MKLKRRTLTVELPTAPKKAAKILLRHFQHRRAERLAAEILTELGYDEVAGWAHCIHALRRGDW
jgi:hypothetical protein